MQGRLFDFLQMGIDAVHGPVVSDQLSRGLLSHLGHARHIVGGIAHQGFDLDKLKRGDPVALQDLGRAEIVDGGLALAGAGDPDADPVSRDLQKVPVPGDQDDVHVPGLSLSGQGPQDIVGLEAGLLADRDPHSREHLFDQRDLLAQLLGHGAPGPLVFGIGLVAEGRRVDVKGDRQIVRLFRVQLTEEDIQKAVDSARMDPFGIGQVGHSVKSSVQDAVPVDQHQFLFGVCVHSRSFSLPGRFSYSL